MPTTGSGVHHEPSLLLSEAQRDHRHAEGFGISASAPAVPARPRRCVAVAAPGRPDDLEPVSSRGRARIARHRLHVRALERHAAWARDYVAVGDVEAAIDEMRDMEALAAELRADDVEVEPSG